jgi:hypothetical protein
VKTKVIFLIIFQLNLFLIHGQSMEFKDILVYGNYGIPVGMTHFATSEFSDNQAALFSNMKHYFSFGTDFNFGNSSRWAFGLSMNFGSYGSWANDKSSRFKESKLTTFEIGPLISFDLDKAKHNIISRLIFCPTLTNVKLINPYDSYGIVVASSKDGLSMVENVNVIETYRHINSWSPGIYLGEETTFFLNERYLLFFRLGLKTSYTKSNAFPDKFLLNPAISVGLGININRDKWFFLK